MKTKVLIYSAKILNAMGNPEAVYARGSTVGECLEDLVSQSPGVEKLLFDRGRQFRREVYVYVNAESLKKVELSRSVKPGDFIIIAVLTTGG